MLAFDAAIKGDLVEEAKLTAEYFKHLLDKGIHDRGYMHTRMPGFGLANVGPVVEAFAALDKTPKVEAASFNEPLPRVRCMTD